MSNELAKIEGGIAVRDDWTDARVELVRKMYCKGASPEEFEVFIETCKRTGLSPLARQIYCIMRVSKGVEQMTIQVGIDGFRLIADRTGRYVPGREPSFTYDEKTGKLATATAYVKKLVAGEWHEVGATVRWDEFAAGGNFWGSMPHHQLAKVAEAHALRRAFPADLSGIYAPEEMDQADRARVEEMPPAALPPAQTATQRTTTPNTAPQATSAPTCAVEGCGASLTQAQFNLSMGKFKRSLCLRHQKEQPLEAPASPQSAEQQERWRRLVREAKDLDVNVEPFRPTADTPAEDVAALLTGLETLLAEVRAGQQSEAEVAA